MLTYAKVVCGRRYVCTPKQLWEWFEPLMEDNEPLKAGRMMDDTPMCVCTPSACSHDRKQR